MAILIVEDQATMRATLRDFLHAAYPGARIVEADCGARALDLCASVQPDLVLMDVCLPDANGIDLIARMRASVRPAAVIIISYLGGRAYVEQALAAGAAAYIFKDRLSAELLPAIERVLDGCGAA